MLMSVSRYGVFGRAFHHHWTHNRSSATRLVTGHQVTVFLHIYRTAFLTIAFQVARMLLAQVNRSARRVLLREVRLALVMVVVKMVTGRMVCYNLFISWTVVAD